MATRGRRPRKDDNNAPALLLSIHDILKKYHLKGSKDYPRLDIEKIIKDNGIKLIKSDELDPNISGYLTRDGQEWNIVVNNKHNPKRQRFTMAHEFAHYCYHRKDRDDNNYFEDKTFFRTRNMDSIEFFANRFAATLLMPEDDVRHYISEGVTNIEKLANIFDVSLLAMKSRISELGYKTIKD